MSRGYPTSFLNAVNSASWNPAIMVRVELGATDVELWTGNGNLTFEGSTFLGAGGLIGVSTLEEGPLQARSVTFTFTGQGSGIYQQIQANKPKGRRLTVWIAAMNDDRSALLAVDSYILANYYYVSRPVLNDNENGWTVALECETEFARLFRSNHKYLSNIDQKARYPDDTFLRFISTLPGQDIPWGKNQNRSSGSGTGISAPTSRPGWGGALQNRP